jgi:succinoglycan biosynthesis transport protein ExoP
LNGFNESETSISTVDIKEYFYLFWSWAWLILLAGLLAGAVAYLVSIRTTPIYQTSTRLLVSAPSAIYGVDPSALVTTQTMTSTYSEMLLDRPVLQGVIDQLELQTTPEDLKKTISVDTVTNTQLLVVTVENTNPALAADVANAIASVFAARIRELQSQRYAASREGLAKQVADMDQQITITSSQIAVMEQQITAAATQVADIGGQITTPAPQAAVMPDPAALQQLQARLTQYRTIYSSLVTSYEQVRLAESQTSTNVVVSEPASVPSIPVRPRTTLNTLVSVLAGMLLAAGVVFAADRLDDTVKNPDEIRKKFDLPILGIIASHEAPEDMPIALAELRSPTAEAFRALRTNITFSAVDKPLRRIMVTSPTPQDGKTTVAANLAVVLAQAEKKVVLIDADLRRPRIHRKFGLSNRIGLTDLFVQPLESLSGVIQFNAVFGPGVITSGPLPPNPAELLTSKKMSKIFDQLGQDFDLILVDTPPLLTVTDATALATAMDGVILVVKPGVTKSTAIQQGLEQLRAVEAHVLGVVLNEVNPGSRKYGYYYNRYSKYSHYYERDGIKPKRTKEKNKPAPERAA